MQGTAVDSIHGVPLADAVIVVEGTGRSGRSSSDGRFRIDSVPAGTHRVALTHALVDTVGLPMRSSPMTFVAGQTANVDFVIPTGDHLAGALCPAAWRERFGPAVMVGFVRDPDTNSPATGAKVEVVFVTTDILGRKQPPTSRSAQVDSAGSYHICGLPTDMNGKVQVFRNGVSSGEVPVAVVNGIALRGFSVAAHQAVAMVADDSGKISRVARGAARLTGRVTDKLGRPLENARVMLQGGVTMVATKSNGEFTLDSLPSGTQAIIVRRLGFGTTEQAVELSASAPARTNVIMADFVPTLAVTRVEATGNSGLERVGYLDRKRTGLGYYLDGPAINQNSLKFSDLMRGGYGLRVEPLGDGRTSVISDSRNPSGGCVTFYLDGAPWPTMTPGDIDDVARPSEIVAVEVYHGAQTPPRFVAPGQSACATVVIWTVAQARPDTRPSKRP